MIEKYIESGLIEPEELHALLGHEHVKILDASYVLPGSPDKPLENFQRERIEGASYFDIDLIADRTSSLPHMLPKPEEFAEAVETMGISGNDLVVVYGQTGIVMGPARLWWTFRVFGHDNVCVLNGGLPAWKKAGYLLDTKIYTQPAKGTFKAGFREDMVKALPQIKQACETGSSLILDARPPGRFDGAEPEPRAGLRSGHMPGSLNIPAGSLINPDTGKLKTAAELIEIFKQTGFTSDSQIITTCGSGVTAAVITLALFHIGHKNTSLYDGSWAEWGDPAQQTEVLTA